MTIEEQADATLKEWHSWVKATGGTFWREGCIEDHELAMWKEGFYNGVEDRIAGNMPVETSDDDLWHYAEDVAWLFNKDMTEMKGKCYAAGYLGGFKSLTKGE